MTHALRQHCGSFLYDSIRAEWGVPGASDLLDKGGVEMETAQGGPVMDGDKQVVKVKCAPKEWPLFSAPGLSSLRVVGYKEKGGVLVSLHRCEVCRILIALVQLAIV